jgi:glycosyltransferase involved in cell wall biosynthesis
LSAARNTGIREAGFDYVAFLDADDFWRPHFLARVIDRFCELDESFAFVATDTERVNDNGEALPKSRHARVSDAWSGELSARHFCLRNRPLSSSIVVRRAAFEELGCFDPRLRSSEDRDMWIRLTQRHRAWFIPEAFALIRRHDSNMSRNAPRMQYNSLEVLTRAWRRGAVPQWEVWFWLRVLAVHYFQSAWTHHDQRFHGRAFGYLLLSVLCWPVFLQPTAIWEPAFFRVRALRHFFNGRFAQEL